MSIEGRTACLDPLFILVLRGLCNSEAVKTPGCETVTKRGYPSEPSAFLSFLFCRPVIRHRIASKRRQSLTLRDPSRSTNDKILTISFTKKE